MTKEQGLIRERDQTPSIRANTPKTLVLLLLYPSFFLSLAQYMSEWMSINEGGRASLFILISQLTFYLDWADLSN